MVEILSQLVGSGPLREWFEKWSKLDIPFQCLRHMADVASDEQALVNDFMRPVTYPSGKTFYMPTPPIQFRRSGQPEYRPAADVGAHTREILMSHGYTEDEITTLMESKVIRVPA